MTLTTATGLLRAYLFKTPHGTVAIAWHRGGQPPELRLPTTVSAPDIVGNPLDDESVKLSATPVYLLAPDANTLKRCLSEYAARQRPPRGR